MTEKVHKLNKALTYCFYGLFAITPLLMFPSTYEIFEFNKMWFVFGISLLIAFLWGTKMILTKKIIFKRTALDIPLLLFLLTQMVATFYSIDPYVSWWGYYSRFNGGLLSTITYIFLYFALTTHLFLAKDTEESGEKISLKILIMSIFGGILVALWGLPSHFGFDPTCMVFGRGFSTECWTDAFKPTIRIFSTLGQPNWLGTYLAILIPIGIAFAALAAKTEKFTLPFVEKIWLTSNKRIQLFFALVTILFFTDLLYTRSKSSYLGLWVGLGLMITLYILPVIIQKKPSIKKITGYFTSESPNGPTRQTLLILTSVLLVLTFVIGIPISQLENYTLQGLIEKAKTLETRPSSVQNPITPDAFGGTDSGNIRLIVWKGGVEIVRAHPFTGTGPETFGYAYYQHRPLEHNLTSEWDYLYNKAHNEYLNYAATSGLTGLLTYLLIITVFYITVLTTLRKKNEYKLVAYGLAGSYSAILVSNFFGFSVVNTNLALFLIPAFFYALTPTEKNKSLTLIKGSASDHSTSLTLIMIVILGIITLAGELKLLRMWTADKSFALGSNLNKVNEVVEANKYLEDAVKVRPQEDLFKSELAINLAYLAYASHMQNMATQAAQFAARSDEMSKQTLKNHPQNIVFYKNRARSLSDMIELDPKYGEKSLEALRTAQKYAPTDAKITYNVGLAYARIGIVTKEKKMFDLAIEEFKKATTQKEDYRDPYNATALTALAAKDALPEYANEYNEIARTTLEKMLEMNPNDAEAKALLVSLGG